MYLSTPRTYICIVFWSIKTYFHILMNELMTGECITSNHATLYLKYKINIIYTIWRILWKLLPWKLKACSKSTLSSTVHSSGNGVKLARSAKDLSMLCLCQNNIPRACNVQCLCYCCPLFQNTGLHTNKYSIIEIYRKNDFFYICLLLFVPSNAF